MLKKEPIMIRAVESTYFQLHIPTLVHYINLKQLCHQDLSWAVLINLMICCWILSLPMTVITVAHISVFHSVQQSDW